MSGSLRDLLFGSKSRCFACKYHRWGLGPMETSNSDARHAVLLAENHRWGLGPIETCYSCPEVAVLHAETTGESWNPYRLFILVQIMLFCIHKTTGEVWYPKRLVLLSKSRCFACKNHRWGLGPIEPSNSGANHAEVNAQNDRSYQGPLETCYSGPEVAVLLAKTSGGV